MDIDPSSAPTSRANDANSPAAVQQTQTTVPPRLSQPEIQSPLPRRRLHPSADKSSTVRTADDGIKIHCSRR
ncbi:hypothetical protein EVAR_91903_1 [Eumeta japonica]|uniref:Uncharacterized protein n=1 Tax=Eumeta variegata TaxID=151549 RepID=A0A4C1SZD1_EUMVA|nr:hypothetical protein EVAR_91903_1 [Eumeta japonica]